MVPSVDDKYLMAKTVRQISVKRKISLKVTWSIGFSN